MVKHGNTELANRNGTSSGDDECLGDRLGFSKEQQSMTYLDTHGRPVNEGLIITWLYNVALPIQEHAHTPGSAHICSGSLGGI